MSTIKKFGELGVSPAPWRDPKSIATEGFVWDEEGRAVCHMSGKPSASFSTLVRLASKMDPSLANVRPMSWKDYEDPKRVESNARLIAAAPELYDAAERYIRFHEESCIHGNRSANEIFADHRKAYQDLKAALAKAGGEEVW